MPIDRSLLSGTCLVLCMAAFGPPALAVSGEGLTPSADPLAWARWAGRISLVAGAPVWRADLASADWPGLKISSARLLGDYYFAPKNFGADAAGGFRATSGLIVGSRTSPWSSTASIGAAGSGFSVERRVSPAMASTIESDTATVPYVGLGYSGASLRGGWSFSADLGVMALNPGGAVKFGRVVGGTQSLDDIVRELRLAPVLQLGVSYSF